MDGLLTMLKNLKTALLQTFSTWHRILSALTALYLPSTAFYLHSTIISTSTTPYWPTTTKYQPVPTYTVVVWRLQTSAQFTLGLFQLDVIIESGKWLMDRLLLAFVDLHVFISWYVNIVATLKRHASLVHFGWKILDSKYSTSNGKKNIAKEPNHQFKQSYNIFSSSATSFTSYIQRSQKLEISKNKSVLVCLVW